MVHFVPTYYNNILYIYVIFKKNVYMYVYIIYIEIDFSYYAIISETRIIYVVGLANNMLWG